MRTYLKLTIATLPLAALAACGDSDTPNIVVPGTGAATVRFINATGNSNINVANNGVVGAGNSNLAFGGTSTCLPVNPTAANGLAFSDAATGATMTGFAPSFVSGGNYTVVAYTDALGNTQFATLNNAFTPTSGNAGLQVFNAAPGSGSVVLNNGGVALNSGATVPFGTNGSFFSVAPGSSTYTFNTGAGTSTIATTDAMNFNAGQNYTLILGPAASGTTALRTTLVGGC